MNRNDIKDASDFREAVIGIVNYMAFARKEVVTFTEPIEVKIMRVKGLFCLQ